ncbi:MAG: MerR family transcriptional regulator [Saprospiraceae bacterium]|nr:MerR family transcriptional regulator [Saprospiraceae bacterium]
MRTYTVKKLAQMSGVSVRTLHHYDKIGLLHPLMRTEARYRFYGEEELLKLQQILFYKELDFSLDAIKVILDDPSFEIINALKQQRSCLSQKKQRLEKLVKTIDKTIDHIKEQKIMLTLEELYEGINPEIATKYRIEIQEKYGSDIIQKSEMALQNMTKPSYKGLLEKQKENSRRLFSLRDEDPAVERVQREIAVHYEIIRQFWGTTESINKQAEAYVGLGQLYRTDERFTMDGQAQATFADFLARAMTHFAEHSLK